jgi:hypothetical protein
MAIVNADFILPKRDYQVVNQDQNPSTIDLIVTKSPCLRGAAGRASRESRRGNPHHWAV